MRREPSIEGTALLVRFKRDEDERKLLLVLHDTKSGQLRAVTDRMRELVRGNPDWIARTSSIGEAEKEPADQKLAMEHLVSGDAPDGSSRVHEGVIKRLLGRLLSDTPGTDFIQTSGVARGPRFFDRPEARNAVLKAASEHRLVLLEAVRRFGKTSLLVSIGDTQPGDAVSIYVSLEGSSSPEHLPRTLVAHAICHPELRGILPAELTGSVEPGATPYEAMDALARNGRSAVDDLSLCWHSLEKQHQKVLFLIDELAFHLSSLRTSAGSSQRSDSEWKALVISILDVLTSAPGNVGFVLAGSLHLPAFLDGHAVRHSLVDSLLPVSLEPISDHEAETMFRLAFLGQRVLATEDDVRWLFYPAWPCALACRQCGCHPLPGYVLVSSFHQTFETFIFFHHCYLVGVLWVDSSVSVSTILSITAGLITSRSLLLYSNFIQGQWTSFSKPPALAARCAQGGIDSASTINSCPPSGGSAVWALRAQIQGRASDHCH